MSHIKPFKSIRQPPLTITSFTEVAQWLRVLWDGLFQARHGHLECTAEITLAINSATTVFADIRLSNQSWIGFDPLTANAAAELYGGTMYVLEANRGTQTCTITHANNAQADRTFIVSILG